MPAEWKIQEVEELRDIITSHSVIGIVGIHGIPAPQMQQMRKVLYNNAVLRVSKCSFIERALENGTGALKEFINGEVGLIAADMNPFKLYQDIEKMRMMAPAKGGESAPEDIIVQKGPTPFNPGPIVGELQRVGIPAAIREGKVVIEKTITLVKKGEKISPDLAKMLARLDIKPIEISLKVHALLEDGIVFKSDVLAINMSAFTASLQQAAWRAVTIAVEISYPTKQTIEPILQKAHRNARHLALECNIYSKDMIEEFIRRAYLHAKTLETKIGG